MNGVVAAQVVLCGQMDDGCLYTNSEPIICLLLSSARLGSGMRLTRTREAPQPRRTKRGSHDVKVDIASVKLKSDRRQVRRQIKKEEGKRKKFPDTFTTHNAPGLSLFQGVVRGSSHSPVHSIGTPRARKLELFPFQLKLAQTVTCRVVGALPRRVFGFGPCPDQYRISRTETASNDESTPGRAEAWDAAQRLV